MEEIKDNNSIKKYKIVIVILIMLIICISVILIYVTYFNKKENNEENSNTSKETEIGNLGWDALNLLPEIHQNITDLEYYDVYQSKKIIPSNIDIKILYANNTFNSLARDCTSEEFDKNGICDFVVPASRIKDNILNRYNFSLDELPDKFYGNGLLQCTLVNENYACSNSGGGWTTSECGHYFVNVLLDNNITVNYKATTDGNNLYLYQKYVNIKEEKTDKDPLLDCPNSYKFKLYKYSDTDELLVDEVIDGKDYYESEEKTNVKSFEEKIIEKYGDKFTTFKHTFGIREDGSYYWISTEEVK